MSLSLLLALTLALFWTLIFGEVSAGQLLLGLLLGGSLAWYVLRGETRTITLQTLPRRLFWLAYILFFLLPLDMLRSNLEIAWRSRPGREHFHPGIVRYELPFCSPLLATLIAYAVTVAPGEMLVDTSSDRCVLYIHVIDATRVPDRIRTWNQYLHAMMEVMR